MKSHHVDLLNEAIAPALTRLALPIMATSLVQMLYNLIDMAWIGRLGAGAVTAVGSAGMYTWFSQGFAILARTGGQVKTAHCLGAGENDSAAQYAIQRGKAQDGDRGHQAEESPHCGFLRHPGGDPQSGQEGTK